LYLIILVTVTSIISVTWLTSLVFIIVYTRLIVISRLYTMMKWTNHTLMQPSPDFSPDIEYWIVTGLDFFCIINLVPMLQRDQSNLNLWVWPIWRVHPKKITGEGSETLCKTIIIKDSTANLINYSRNVQNRWRFNICYSDSQVLASVLDSNSHKKVCAI